MIDPHVHLRDWGQHEKESLAHGFTVALECGVTELFDMPNTNPPLIDTATIERRLEAARQTGLGMRYHIWAGVTQRPEQIREVASLVRSHYSDVIGLKYFAGHSTGNMGLIEEGVQRSVWSTLADAGYDGVVALHCEKESLLRPDLAQSDDHSTHSLARPPEAEITSIEDQIALSAEAGFLGHLHICHLSTIGGLEAIERAREAGRRISCGVTPHHVLLSDTDAKDPNLWARMNPPLRSEGERSLLLQALLDGRIDWIETDHAPHTLADKEGGASGIPGFSGLLLLIKVLLDRGIGATLLERLVAGAVIDLFGLERRKPTIPPYEELIGLSERAAQAYPYDSFRTLRATLR
jgi:dihydroorotase